jgi:N-acetylmuramoyl-L-alanine amidase
MNFRRTLLRTVLLFALLLPACRPYPGRLSPLAPEPKWRQLNAFQETITRADFIRLLDGVYAPAKAAADVVVVEDNCARIREINGTDRWFTLRFAESPAAAKTPPLYWRPVSALRATHAGSATKPLAGWRIAIDPGHLGGRWAQMEARWFVIGNSKPVTEGDMALITAYHLADELRGLGADPVLVRDSDEPATPLRPEQLHKTAQASLAQPGHEPGAREVRIESERLFYRTAEIRSRADIVNDKIRPDLVVCLHYNADPWGDPRKPALTTNNHLHLIVNGCYSAAELANDDVRFDMLLKLLSRTYDPELAMSETVARAMARATGLPPFAYGGNNARRVGTGEYVWARNLLANRLYRCPVVYVEPYVMNNRGVFERAQAGDYPGEKLVAGRKRPSIMREYAHGVAEGLKDIALKSGRP